LTSARSGAWLIRGYFTTANFPRPARRPALKETLMKKTVTALLAAAAIAASLAATPTPASAGGGGAFAAGLFGGLVGGAIIGSALARPYPGYVAYSGVYASPPPPGCYWTRQPVYDAVGNIVGWRGRPVAVCP
jgi:hypothetical protein